MHAQERAAPASVRSSPALLYTKLASLSHVARPYRRYPSSAKCYAHVLKNWHKLRYENQELRCCQAHFQTDELCSRDGGA